LTRDEFRTRRPNVIGADRYKRFAVFVPIVDLDGSPALLFEKRAESLRQQPGEICFPGGRVEAEESSEECAVRETKEELLVSDNDIEIYGPGDLFVSPFNFVIHPFIGRLTGYDGRFNTDEVAETFFVPIDYFRTNEPERHYCPVISAPKGDFPFARIPGGKRYKWHIGSQEVLFYQYDDAHLIWGITAQIVRSAVRLIDTYGLA
jgi:coenzyme A diphosphatase NUDT7